MSLDLANSASIRRSHGGAVLNNHLVSGDHSDHRGHHKKAKHGSVAKRTHQFKLSFVIPLKDEAETIIELYDRIAAEVGPDESFEVIFVDDGSRDGSWDVIQTLVEREPGHVRGLRFRRNAGKACALTAGFRAARGQIVFTMDADLQDDPKEIPRFLDKLAEGYDLVSGWKKVRHDPWHKVLPSRVFNRMLSWVSSVSLHDHNCGFKCYRSEVAKHLTLYGELHRMVPALAAIEGYSAAEIDVEHHPRIHGVSKYGFERYIRGFVDMLIVGFYRKYRERPAHFIGGVSALCAAMAGALFFVGLLLSITLGGAAAVTTLIAGTILFSTAVIGAFCSVLAELTIRGGLATDWKLPIVQDTASEQSANCDHPTPIAPLHLGYHTHQSALSPSPSTITS